MTIRLFIMLFTIASFTSCDLKSAGDYLKEGHSIGLTGNYEAAIPLFDKAIKKNPRLKDAYIQRGLCYENIKQDSLAINDYQKLLSFDPKNTTAFYYIGLCKYRQNKFEEAIEFYNKALFTKGIPDQSDTSTVQIALDLNKNGILAEQAAFDVASAQIYYERGLAYYATQQIKRAYRDFQNCITQKYNLDECFYMSGLCLQAANKSDKAYDTFKQSPAYGNSMAKNQLDHLCK